MSATRTSVKSQVFAPTRWTLVLRARGRTPEARSALGDLCAAYWKPVYRFILRGGRDEDTARDLTQEFFARLLEGGRLDRADPNRGRFRSFLLGAVKHFLADRRDHDRRLKRGGGAALEPLEAADASDPTTIGLQVADPGAEVPDTVFDREWALAIMDNALRAVEREFAAEGRQGSFEALKPWLAGDAIPASQADAARRLGLTENALKVAVHRLRKRFRECVKEEIGQTIGDPALARDELRYLVEVLAQPPVM